MNAKLIIKRLGGPGKVAAMVGGITSQAVSQWTKVPVARCHAIARATNNQITVHELRPDIFGPAPGVAPVVATPIAARPAVPASTPGRTRPVRAARAA